MPVGSGTRFHFWVKCVMVFCLFLWPPWPNLNHALVWLERSDQPSKVYSWQSCPWPLKLMRSQVVEGMHGSTQAVMGSSGVNGLMKRPNSCLLLAFFTWFNISWLDLVVLCLKVDFLRKLGTLLNISSSSTQSDHMTFYFALR